MTVVKEVFWTGMTDGEIARVRIQGDAFQAAISVERVH